MNKQQIFDKAIIGVLSQNNYAIKKISYNNYTCLLKTKSGNRCAFGQLIEPKLYVSDMEDVSSLENEDIFDRYPDLSFLRKHRELLFRLQSWHDVAGLSMPSYMKNDKKVRIKYMFKPENLFNVVSLIAKEYKVSMKNVNAYIESRKTS